MADAQAAPCFVYRLGLTGLRTANPGDTDASLSQRFTSLSSPQEKAALTDVGQTVLDLQQSL